MGFLSEVMGRLTAALLLLLVDESVSAAKVLVDKRLVFGWDA